MFDSLKVQRFRAFDSFDLPGLTRVNLLVGKNNAGKTCLLDAVEMAVLAGSVGSLVKSPIRRREIWLGSGDKGSDRLEMDLSHIFFGHEIHDGASFEITAGNGDIERRVRCDVRPRQEDLFPVNPLSDDPALDSPLEVVLTGPDNPNGTSIPVSPNGHLLDISRSGPSTPLLPPQQGTDARPIVATPPRTAKGARVWFLGSGGVPPWGLQTVWDLFVLSPEEEKVIAALQIIEPDIQRLAFTGQGSESTAFVKLKGEEQRIPLGSLGDGIGRLLAQAIYLALSAKGVLLIDEVDTGLHHSTMESMWRFIIESARRLDVQVFATSHSGDCIRALAWLQTDRPDLASDISVHRIDKAAQAAVRYSAADIEIAARHHIEVRG